MKKKTKKNEVYHLLVYVLDSETKIKRFETTAAMGKFIDAFNKKYPDYAELYAGNWIDFCIEGVTGPVSFFTDGLKVE